MKFNEFQQIEHIINNQNLSTSDLSDKNHKELNEIFGINKHLLSWGVKKATSNKLKNEAIKLESDINSRIKKATNKLIATKLNIINSIESGQEIPGNIQKQIYQIEKNIIDVVNDLSNKLSKLKTDQIETVIRNSKKLKDSHKQALLYYWETLLSEIKIDAMVTLLKTKVIENPNISDVLYKAINNKRDNLDKAGQELDDTLTQSEKEIDDKEEAVQDENNDKNAESIDTPWLDEFSLTGNNANIKFKASSVYDDWKRIFDIEKISGDSDIDPSNVAVFNKRIVKLNEPVKIDFYDREGEYVKSKVFTPSELKNWRLIDGDETNYGEEVIIPPVPEDLPDEATDDNEAEKPEMVSKIEDNILKTRKILDNILKSKEKTKEEKIKGKNRAKEIIIKLANQIKSLEDGDYKDGLIKLIEEKFKGAISLFPEYKEKVKQSIISPEDKEILK